jgi:shikimate kinase
MIEYENGGQTIAGFLAESDGDWRPFRDLEFQVVQKVSRLSEVIIDCGGGVVVELDESGREIYSERKVAELKAGGPIVWLSGDIARLAAKAKPGGKRPTLDASRSVEAVMRSRLLFYEAAADHVLDIEGKARSTLAKEIIALFPEDLPTA